MKDKLILLLLVFLGGGLGSLTRLYLGLYTESYLKAYSPAITLAFLHTADLISAFLIGIFIFFAEFYKLDNKKFLAFTKTGFLGGLSSFSILTIIYADTNSYALSYVAILGEIMMFVIVTVISYYLIKTIYNLVLGRHV